MNATAFIFPGQGAQQAGMGKDLAAAAPEARALLDRAAAVLGWDVPSVCFEGPQEELTRSDRAQPALFAVSAACLEVWRRRRPGAEPAACAGLSSGEWTALYAAGVARFDDLLRLLEARGRFMQEACERTPGAMLAVIGLDTEVVERVAAEAGVAAANYNAPGQIVLSGAPEGIERAEALARDAGAKRVARLQVAGAFHSPLMAPAAERMAAFLADFPLEEPRLPVYSNVTARPHGSVGEMRRLMVDQIVSPVRWEASVRALRAAGIATFVELGCGRVLGGLVKRIDKSAAIHTIQDGPTMEAAAVAVS